MLQKHYLTKKQISIFKNGLFPMQVTLGLLEICGSGPPWKQTDTNIYL